MMPVRLVRELELFSLEKRRLRGALLVSTTTQKEIVARRVLVSSPR